MRFSVLISAVATSASFISAVIASSGNGTANCEALSLSIPVSARNVKFVGVDQSYSNQSYITEQFLQLAIDPVQWSNAHIANESIINNKTYDIHARYCTPQQGALDDSPLILAVHGINYNSKYWDFDYAPEYSFAQAATAKGYSIVIYDRLGTGLSQDTTNGFDEPQAATEVEILAGVLSQLRAGTAVPGKQFSKIVGVGHSYGSAQMQSITSSYPELLDGVVLTGFSNGSASFSTVVLAGSFTPIRNVFPERLPNKPSVWISTGDDASHIEAFFWPPNYAQGAFDLARDYVDGATIAAFATLTTITKTAANFTGPVYVQTGERDVTYCGLHCDVSQVAAVECYYPKTTNFSYDFIPDTGHGIVPHYSGPQSLQDILTWIGSHF